MADDWGLLDPLTGEASVLTDDAAVLHALIETEQALTAAWHDTGLAPEWVGQLELAGAEADLDGIARGTRAGGNPVIPLVGQLRVFAESQRRGAGDWVHRGATSQDILDTALMLVASRAADQVTRDLRALGSTLAALAEEHRATLMVGRTLTQHAAPMTFGAKVASWLDGVDVALAAIDSVSFPVQLAGSVGVGSAFAELAGTLDANVRLRAAVAARLGLTDPQRSWQAERSPVVAVSTAFALVVGVLGRIAADILVLARPEIGELTEGSAGASSAMPQKRNPTTSVLVRSAGLQVPGLLATIQLAVVTAEERGAGEWHSEWHAFRRLARLAVESAAASSLGSLSVNADRMAQNLDLDGGRAWAEQARSQLVPDLGSAEADALIARALDAVSSGLPFAGALAAELDGRLIDLSSAGLVASCALIVDAALDRHSALTSERGRP